MRNLSSITLALLVLGAFRPALAEDTAEHDLELRNAARAKEFDAEAQTYQTTMQGMQRDATAAQQANAANDARDARAYGLDIEAAHQHASRKTALVLTAVAVGMAGAGALTYQSARSGEADIQRGGFATGQDIQSKIDHNKMKREFALGAWGAGGVLGCVAVGFAW